MRAREIRGDFTFGEQILDIADDGSNDWIEAKNGGAPRVNKELVLRSKLRIEARQFHMSHLHPQQWGEKQTIDIKSDWALLSEDERRRKADELIAIIRELKEPPMQPPTWSTAPKKPLTMNQRIPEGLDRDLHVGDERRRTEAPREVLIRGSAPSRAEKFL
jgi:hypothetical protein